MNGDFITVLWDNNTYSSNLITVTDQVINSNLFSFSQVSNTGFFTLPSPVPFFLFFYYSLPLLSKLLLL